MGTQQGCALAFSKHQHLRRRRPWQQGHAPSSPCPLQRLSLARSALALRTGHQGSVKWDGEASAAQTPTLMDPGAPGALSTLMRTVLPKQHQQWPTLMTSEMPLSLRLSTKVSRG